MLILCLGPDTFRAQQKAQELRTYFISKYDVNASSVERVDDGKTGIQQIIERTGTASLFAPRRYFYGRDLLGACSKSLLSPFLRALSSDAEHMIVVSLETEAPASTLMKEVESRIIVVRYDHPFLQGLAFKKWAQEFAQTIPFQDLAVIEAIAKVYDGDTWMAASELMKAAAGDRTVHAKKRHESSLYDLADRFLDQQNNERSFLQNDDQAGAMLSVMVQQTRALLRVRDKATAGLHPFVTKKMSQMKVSNAEIRFARALSALVAQRSGLGDEAESAMLL